MSTSRSSSSSSSAGEAPATQRCDSMAHLEQQRRVDSFRRGALPRSAAYGGAYLPDAAIERGVLEELCESIIESIIGQRGASQIGETDSRETT